MARRRSHRIPKHRGESELSPELTPLSPLPAGLIEQKYDASDVTLNYATGQSNGPSLLLIHGLGGMMHDFLNVYELLKDRWQVTLLDLRGHGKSTWITTGYNFDSYHHDIVGLMRHVIGGPAVVWGHSLGAITAMSIAAYAPYLVTAAILEDPPMMIGGDPSHSPFLANFKATQDLMRSSTSDNDLLATLRESQSSRMKTWNGNYRGSG